MFIDPHIHMQARTTDDYEAMAKAGIVAVLEPAFWVGQPRTNVGAFQHYYSSLVGWERFRASQFGIRHYCMMGLNSKEANDADLPVCVHTPHRNKKQGTFRSMEIAIEHGIDPSRVVIDHNNEETVKEVLDRGFWAAFTIYPRTKMGNERMVAIARTYGPTRVLVDSSAD